MLHAQVIPIQRARRQPDRCQAVTAAGKACRNKARSNGFCGVHQPPSPAERIGPFSSRRVEELLEVARRRLLGDYEVDEFGFDPELTEKFLLPLVKPLYEYYWRADWQGLQNIPSKGAALLVGNHAGTVPVDADEVRSARQAPRTPARPAARRRPGLPASRSWLPSPGRWETRLPAARMLYAFWPGASWSEYSPRGTRASGRATRTGTGFSVSAGAVSSSWD
jgi:hypothetical protein